ncbi:MAG: methyl-accepting chemotaxis protein [Selenomonadaceae bacterium]|nr:methyl-accepting chemotaxis protein [Selenomonadaceae bacterium]
MVFAYSTVPATGWIVGITAPADKVFASLKKMNDLPVESKDEIGTLTGEFNTMKGNLQKVIAKMSHNSEQVAAASEELT